MTFTGNGWTPKHWVTIPLTVPPESLPGYAEAKAAVERGESLVAPARVRVPRLRRSLESLTAERDRLVAKRDLLGGSGLPDDPGALSGIRRKATAADRKSAARMDRELGLYVKWSQKIAYLNGRIARY